MKQTKMPAFQATLRLLDMLHAAARWWQDDDTYYLERVLESDLTRIPTVSFATLDIGGWMFDLAKELEEEERGRKATSLHDAEATFNAKLPDGTVCPCCRRYAKIYKRRITRPMARALFSVFTRSGHAWTNVPSETGLSRMGGDWAKLAMWGLIEESKSGPHSGWWRVTRLGAKWAQGRARVARRIHVYNASIVDRDDETVSIGEIIGRGHLR